MFVELEYHKSRHLNQIYAGFESLHRQRIIDLKVKQIDNFDGEDMIAKVIVNGKYKVIYDTLDGLNWVKIEDEALNLSKFKKLTSEVDFYFKRSYEESLKNIVPSNCTYLPLGLNYNVIPERKLVRESFSQSIGRIKDLKRVYRDIVNYKVDHLTASDYEFKPLLNKKDQILFLCRLWEYDIYNHAPIFQSQIAEINNSRIESIRACRKVFGDRFIGGVYNDPNSHKYAPDLVVPSKVTYKLNFLKLVKSSNICIGTTGLHNSIGWKIGEYVAASRAIISEPLHYDVPGDFREDNNYLKFETTDELLSKIEYLLSNKSKVKDMMDSNYKYYQRFLKPDKIVLNSLSKVLSLEENENLNLSMKKAL